MKTRGRVFGILISVLIFAALILEPISPTALASPPEQDIPNVEIVSKMSSLSAEEKPHFWTKAEMEAAIPIPFPEVEKNAFAPRPLTLDEYDNLTPTMIPGSPPYGEQDSFQAAGLELLSFGAPTDYTYPPPFTRYISTAKYEKEWPHKAIGKLFFNRRGLAFVCTAAVVGTHAIWTAGHCLHDGSNSPDGWSYNIMFAPGYPKNKLGRYTASRIFVPQSWYESRDYADDMGGVVLRPNKKTRVSSKTGILSIAWNMPRQQHWFQIGYPAEAPFNGSSQVVCASSYSSSDTYYSPPTVGVGCDQTGGSSGGPWIIGYGTGYYINGNTSYGFVGYPLEMFSPYFGDNAAALYYNLVNTMP